MHIFFSDLTNSYLDSDSDNKCYKEVPVELPNVFLIQGMHIDFFLSLFQPVVTFAGEHCHPSFYSTGHGAFLTGRTASQLCIK